MRQRLSVAATIALTMLALLAMPAGASAAKRHRHGHGATGTHLSPACASDRAVAAKPGKKGASSHQSAPAGCPTGTTLARLLAAGITHGGAAARERGIVNAMRYLHIGVISASGKPLVIAPEIGGAQYFQLYDFELRGFASQLRVGQTQSLDEFAGRLSLLTGDPPKIGGKPISGATVRQLLLDATHYALRHRGDPRTLLPLLVRALGQRHKGPRYDLGKRPAAARIVLDPLQAALVEIALVLPELRDVAAAAPGAHASAAAIGPVSRSDAATTAGLGSACAYLLDKENALKQKVLKALDWRRLESSRSGLFMALSLKAGFVFDKLYGKSAILHLGREFGNNSTGWTQAFGRLAKPALRALLWANALHDVLLAALIDVSPSESAQQTHWDHGDGTTGKPMTFSVSVRMPFNLGKGVVKCGTLATFKLPPKGPIAGVSVRWTDYPPGALAVLHPGRFLHDGILTPDMGTTNCGTLPCTTTTGANGVAQLVFTPRKEPIPGTGPQYERKGHMYPTAEYQSAEGGRMFIGQIAQFLFPSGTFDHSWTPPAWTVTYHKVPNFVLDFKATVTPQDPEIDGGPAIGCIVPIKVTDTGAVTVEGTIPLQLSASTDPTSDPDTLIWFPAGTLSLKHTDTSLEETGSVDDCGQTEISHDTIPTFHDGAMGVNLVWAKGDDSNGSDSDPLGLVAQLQVSDQPTESDYCDICYWGHSSGPRPGWLDAVNQVLLGSSWDGDESDLAGQEYRISSWQRSTDAGVYATRDFDESGVVDNNIIGTFVNVHVHMELRPVPRG